MVSPSYCWKYVSLLTYASFVEPPVRHFPVKVHSADPRISSYPHLGLGDARPWLPSWCPRTLQCCGEHRVVHPGCLVYDIGCILQVQRAFEYYIKEKPHGIKQTDFSAREAAALTAEWLTDNVSWAMEKSSRFEAIVDAAIAHMKEVRVAKKASIIASSSRGGAPKLYEPPSSP